MISACDTISAQYDVYTLFAKQLERPCAVDCETCLCASGEDAAVGVESGVEDENWCGWTDMIPSEVHSEGDGGWRRGGRGKRGVVAA